MFELLDYDLTSNLTEEDFRNMLFAMSVKEGSDLFVMGGNYVWMSIHGRKEQVTKRSLKDNEVNSLLQAIYGDNAKSVLGSRKPINTQYEFKREVESPDGILRKKRFRFRVNAVGCQRNGRNSVIITIRTIPTTPPTAKELGIEKDILDVCRAADQGLILVVGATGNGKSTLLASILRDQLEDPEGHRNMVTIEAPIEFVYDTIIAPTSFVTQLEVGRHIDNFHAGVVNSLRMAPTTILVGEARDYETISSAINASSTGHVVFSTVHANSVAETFQRMISEYPKDMQHQAAYNLIQATKLVVAQRLIRTVDGKRTAIREYLILTQEIKDALLNGDNIAQTAFSVVEKYGRPIMADVQEKFNSRIISKELFERMKLNYQLESGIKGE